MFEALAIGFDHRQIDVRIGSGISVAGKMLCGGQSSIFLRATDEFAYELGDAQWVFAKGACIDDGIARIVVHVADGRINPLNTNGARFEGCDFAHGVSVSWIACGRQGHRRWKRSAFILAHGCAAFEVCADQQREL